jgi:LacI family transcriptional regulator
MTLPAKRQPRILLVMGSRYVARVHHGVAEYAGQRHWHLSNLFGDDPNLVRDRECDGIIAALGEEDPLSDAVIQRRKPTVSVSVARDRLKMPHITGDNVAMGHSAASHFLGRGFKRFIWYAETTEASARLRFEGFRNALEGEGKKCRALVLPETFPSGPPKWRTLSTWIQRSVREAGFPCAVYAFNDSQAVNFLDACLAGGIRIPEEVALLGTDNHPLVCPTAAVPISSVNHDLDEIGRRAAAELGHLMGGGRRERRIIEVPHRGLSVRQSSDIFAIHDPQVVQALHFLYQNFDRNIGVAQVVEATNLSRRSLERRFRAHLKCSVRSKLSRLRMDRACELLRESDASIAEVAARSGYTTAEYFHRCFRHRWKMTPRHYRKAYRLGGGF